MSCDLPGVCQRCRASLVWNGRFWKDAGTGARRHACAVTAETIEHMFADMARNDPEFRQWVDVENRIRFP